MSAILLTGGSGFIGSAVVDALGSAGHQVRVLDLVAPRSARDFEFVCGDVTQAVDCERALDGVSVVVHQAAKVGLGVDVADLPGYAHANVVGTATLLSAMAAAGVPQLVFASSMVVYGEGAYECPSHGAIEPGPRLESDLAGGQYEPTCPQCARPLIPGLVSEGARLDPRNAYAASKVGQEHFAAAWARATGGTAVGLRYHNVYGPGLPRDTPYAGVAAIFCTSLSREEAPRVFEDGGQRRDFVHVRDVAAANLAALGAPVAAGEFRAYNVGSGTVRTIGEMGSALAESVNGPTPVVTGEYRLGDVRHVTASSTRAYDELGWQASEDFASGMAELAAELGVSSPGVTSRGG